LARAGNHRMADMRARRLRGIAGGTLVPPGLRISSTPKAAAGHRQKEVAKRQWLRAFVSTVADRPEAVEQLVILAAY